MGSYASLSIGKYDFLLSKNTLDPSFLYIYNITDKNIEKGHRENGEERIRYTYITNVTKAKQSLDIIGYTIKELKQRFEIYKKEMSFNFEDDEKAYDQFTYESWSKAFLEVANELIRNGIDYENLEEWIKSTEDYFVKYFILRSLDDWDADLYFGVPYEIDPWYIIRLLIEDLPNDTEIVLDYTDLVYGGWYDAEQKVESFYGKKVIVLTEGKSDSKIISKSLQLLYPHLHHFYFFMDFDISKAQGSTNFLTHYIKAFIGAGITNKIIALFDNDSAAHNELLNLKDIKIPPNIKILTLPEIEIGYQYPTIGPYNNQAVNINGLACSIELFLGENVLRDEQGHLTPVVWKGYIERINKYQGEIANKDVIQQRFFQSIDQIERGNKLQSSHDWMAMDMLLRSIFEAFKK